MVSRPENVQRVLSFTHNFRVYKTVPDNDEQLSCVYGQTAYSLSFDKTFCLHSLTRKNESWSADNSIKHIRFSSSKYEMWAWRKPL